MNCRILLFNCLWLSYLWAQDAATLYKQAFQAYQDHAYREALQSLDAILARNPNHKEARSLRAKILEYLGYYNQAKEDYSFLIQTEQLPNYYIGRARSEKELHQFQEALQDCDSALHLYKDYAEGYRCRCAVLLSLYRFEEAKNACKKALQLNPKDYPSKWYLAQVYDRMHDPRAVEYYLKALEPLKREPENLYHNALVYYALQKRDTAIALMLECIRIAPEFTPAYPKLAQWYSEKGDLKKGFAALNTVLSINPRHIEALYLKADVYIQLKAYKEAERLLKSLLKYHPSYAPALIQLAVIKTETNEFSAAIALLDKVLKENPNDPVALNNKGNIYLIQGDYRKAWQLYQKALDINPYNGIVWNNLGAILRLQGNCEKALYYFNKALQLKTHYPNALINRAFCYYNLQQYDKAYEDLMRVEEPLPTQGLTLLAHIYMRRQQWDKALQTLKKALEQSPKDAEVHFHIANLYLEKEQIPKALYHYNQAIEIAPKFAEAYLNRATAFLHRGEYNLALKDLNKAIELKPTLAMAFYNRGIVFYNRQNIEKACEDWKKAAELGEKSAEKLLKKYCK